MPWGSNWDNSPEWKANIDKAFDKEFGSDSSKLNWNVKVKPWVEEVKEITEVDWSKLKEHVNKVPTHDPYTNPNAQIYFQCSCGAIHDPGTKSFAALTGSASKAGWKVRFVTGVDHYTAYCVKCGEIVE